MNPHNQTNLLIVVLGVIALLAVLVLKRRGMRADLEEKSPTRARTVTTRIQTMVKLARPPGAKADFPKLRVMCRDRRCRSSIASKSKLCATTVARRAPMRELPPE